MSYETDSKEGGVLAHNMDESKVTTYGAEVIPSPVELGRVSKAVAYDMPLMT